MIRIQTQTYYIQSCQQTCTFHAASMHQIFYIPFPRFPLVLAKSRKAHTHTHVSYSYLDFNICSDVNVLAQIDIHACTFSYYSHSSYICVHTYIDACNFYFYLSSSKRLIAHEFDHIYLYFFFSDSYSSLQTFTIIEKTTR